MAWVKVPPENHPIFFSALPKDPRVETMNLFGGVAAKIQGNVFAGLFGRSAILWLPESERAEALALPGASRFDPMGNGRVSDKVMLPERMMRSPAELARWFRRGFDAAARLPPKAAKKPKKVAAAAKPAKATKKPTTAEAARPGRTPAGSPPRRRPRSS